MFLKYKILDDYNIRELKPQTKNFLLIRLLEPSYKKDGISYNIRYLEEYKNVLNLYFQDISEELNPCPKYIKIFTNNHIRQIIKTLKKDNYDEIIIHCNMGQSRSPAIMLGILKLMDKKIINKCDNFDITKKRNFE